MSALPWLSAPAFNPLGLSHCSLNPLSHALLNRHVFLYRPRWVLSLSDKLSLCVCPCASSLLHSPSCGSINEACFHDLLSRFAWLARSVRRLSLCPAFVLPLSLSRVYLLSRPSLYLLHSRLVIPLPSLGHSHACWLGPERGCAWPGATSMRGDTSHELLRSLPDLCCGRLSPHAAPTEAIVAARRPNSFRALLRRSPLLAAAAWGNISCLQDHTRDLRATQAISI